MMFSVTQFTFFHRNRAETSLLLSLSVNNNAPFEIKWHNWVIDII